MANIHLGYVLFEYNTGKHIILAGSMINHINRDKMLTPRQFEVLQLVAKGFTNDEIAEKMFITKHTVKAHICAIFEVLEVTSRVQAITKGLKLGILDIEKF